MKKFSVVAVLFLFVAGLAAAETITGKVMDTKCATAGKFDHSKACAQKCVSDGSPAVLVTDDKKVYKIHNGDAVKDHVGNKVTAMGKMMGDAIHIDSVKPAS